MLYEAVRLIRWARCSVLGGTMTVKFFACKPAVYMRTSSVAGLIFLLAALAQAQSKPDKPLLWYHPDTKMTAAERGDVEELKGLHRICVSIAPGLTSEG